MTVQTVSADGALRQQRFCVQALYARDEFAEKSKYIELCALMSRCLGTKICGVRFEYRSSFLHNGSEN